MLGGFALCALDLDVIDRSLSPGRIVARRLRTLPTHLPHGRRVG
jgi:hypothetical protein